MQKACECFGEARDLIREIYGKDTGICNIVNLFDYIWEVNHGDYRAAALKLADAGELLEHFSEKDVADEFTGWINENKNEMLNEAVAFTYNMLLHLNFDINIENLFMQALLCADDQEELINRTMIDSLGLPRRFQYLVHQFCKDSKSITGDMKAKTAELLMALNEMQNIDANDLSEKERMDFAKKLFGMINQNSTVFEQYAPARGMSRFLKFSGERIHFDLAKGMMESGDTEIAIQFLEGMQKKDISNSGDQIKIMLLDCWVHYLNGDKTEAEKILDEVMEALDGIISQVFFLKNEKKKIEFLKGLAYITKRIVEICFKIRGAVAAYFVVVRTRTLNFDRSVIRLDSEEHSWAMFGLKELEAAEKEGKDISLEKAEMQEYLEKVSGGIFTLDSMDICRKLKDDQAVLELTIMTDIRDRDIYYAFVVTSSGITAVELEKCSEIDGHLDRIIEYITDYTVTKHSAMQINMLPAYYYVYEKIMRPIGEVLPRKSNRLFFAAAGKFFQIPIGMLPDFHWYDDFMEDNYRISYINSGKEILKDSCDVNNQGAIVIGDPDFKGKYQALPFSFREVKAVAEILGVSPITGKEAVPDCLKKHAGIIHISTHSFDDQNSESMDIKDPMDRSGLIFAGGNGGRDEFYRFYSDKCFCNVCNAFNNVSNLHYQRVLWM